jgi:hypothetical protein
LDGQYIENKFPGTLQAILYKVNMTDLWGQIKHTYLQGGAMNRGLLFAAPPLLPFGGCERKD